MYKHEYYNRDNFPHFVVNHGNWDIYRNAAGKCAAIAVDYTQCQSTDFGDMKHVARVNRDRQERVLESFPRYLNEVGRDTVKRLMERHGVERVAKLAKTAMTQIYKGTEASFESAFDAMERNLNMGTAYDRVTLSDILPKGI